jgi:DnaJ-domain-containing protein 1
MSEIANPLLPLVLQLLRENPIGISEYDLLKKIEANSDHFADLADEAQLALFQKHFLVMNALYRLQDTLWCEERLWLSISPLRIALEMMPRSAAAGDSDAANIELHSDDALRTYYLDWRQFAAADSSAVADLLARFWTRYTAHDRRAQALATLQLDSDADKAAIKQQYRRLAAATHPDRGGDAAQFLSIRAAYEILKEL